MNYKKTKRIGSELIVIGITILLCTLFFIFFGTRLLIDTAYLPDSNPAEIAEVSDSDDNGGENTAEETTTAQSNNSNNSGNNSAPEKSTEKPSVVFEGEQDTTKKTETTQQDSISIPGVKSITVAKNSKTASVDLYNPAANNCYFEISIIIKNGNKQIYKSKLVRPGQHIYEIELSQPLPAGEYEATLHYDTYAMDDDYTELNGANVAFTLIVE